MLSRDRNRVYRAIIAGTGPMGMNENKIADQIASIM
jgi:hypothetical protein